MVIKCSQLSVPPNKFGCMTTSATAESAGHARYTYRVRLSKTARGALEAEWDRCRWLWNECVAKSKAVHLHYLFPNERMPAPRAEPYPPGIRTPLA